MVMLRMERNMMTNKAFLRSAFAVFDESGTGSIDSDTLEESLTKRNHEKNEEDTVTTKEAQEMIKMADRDGDGTVDFDEFWTYASEQMILANDRAKARATGARANFVSKPKK